MVSEDFVWDMCEKTYRFKRIRVMFLNLVVEFLRFPCILQSLLFLSCIFPFFVGS